MTDYRLVMSLLIQNLSYRQIEALAGCSHTTVAMLLYCVKRFSEIFRRPMLIPSTDVFQSRCH